MQEAPLTLADVTGAYTISLPVPRNRAFQNFNPCIVWYREQPLCAYRVCNNLIGGRRIVMTTATVIMLAYRGACMYVRTQGNRRLHDPRIIHDEVRSVFYILVNHLRPWQFRYSTHMVCLTVSCSAFDEVAAKAAADGPPGTAPPRALQIVSETTLLYGRRVVEKNWMPLPPTREHPLRLVYAHQPLEIIEADPRTGDCRRLCRVALEPLWAADLGAHRGPAVARPTAPFISGGSPYVPIGKGTWHLGVGHIKRASTHYEHVLLLLELGVAEPRRILVSQPFVFEPATARGMVEFATGLAVHRLPASAGAEAAPEGITLSYGKDDRACRCTSLTWGEVVTLFASSRLEGSRFIFP